MSVGLAARLFVVFITLIAPGVDRACYNRFAAAQAVQGGGLATALCFFIGPAKRAAGADVSRETSTAAAERTWTRRAICDYEGTSYRARFWEGQGRDYEDLAERIALRKLLPPQGRRILEIGAGFGRLADLYSGYEQVILLDYAKSGLREAQQRLGMSGRFVYVAADLYHLPLAPSVCDTVVRSGCCTIWKMSRRPCGGSQKCCRPGGTYVLEYANKRNLKAIARYLLRTADLVAFHPRTLRVCPAEF